MPERGDIDIPLAEKCLTTFSDRVFPLCTGKNQLALFERIGERHTEFAGKVVIAGPSESDRLVLTDGIAFSWTRDHTKGLHGMGHVGRRNSIIAMPSLRCDFDKSALKQLSQMHAG